MLAESLEIIHKCNAAYFLFFLEEKKATIRIRLRLKLEHFSESQITRSFNGNDCDQMLFLIKLGFLKNISCLLYRFSILISKEILIKFRRSFCYLCVRIFTVAIIGLLIGASYRTKLTNISAFR